MRIKDFKLATTGMPRNRSLWASFDQAVRCPLTKMNVIDDHTLELTHLASINQPLTIADLTRYPDQATVYLIAPQGEAKPVFGYRVVAAGLLLN